MFMLEIKQKNYNIYGLYNLLHLSMYKTATGLKSCLLKSYFTRSVILKQYYNIDSNLPVWMTLIIFYSEGGCCTWFVKTCKYKVAHSHRRKNHKDCGIQDAAVLRWNLKVGVVIYWCRWVKCANSSAIHCNTITQCIIKQIHKTDRQPDQILMTNALIWDKYKYGVIQQGFMPG